MAQAGNMKNDPCEKPLKIYEKAVRKYIRYYRTIISVHKKFTSEHIRELEKLEKIKQDSKDRWLKCINNIHLE